MPKKKDSTINTTVAGKIRPVTGSGDFSRRKLYGALVIFLFAFLLYANTVPNGYCMDDKFVTAQNALVKKGIKAIPTIFTTPYTTTENVNSDYRPIVKVTYAIECEIFGENPHVSHFLQALFYALICVLLYYVFLLILEPYNMLLSFVAALLFAAHPIHTEVVANLKNRDELLSFFFSLGALYFLIKVLKEEKKYLLLVVGMLFVLALLSKLSGLTLVIWVPLILYYVNYKKKWTDWTAVACTLLAAFIIVVGMRAWLDSSAGLSARPITFSENPLAGKKDVFLYAVTALKSLNFYFFKCIFPHPLAWYYGYNTIPLGRITEPQVLFALITHTALFGWAIYGLRRRTVYSLAILLYLTAISAFVNVVSLMPGIVAERFAFYASMGFCLGAAMLILKLSGVIITEEVAKPKALFYLLLIPVLLLYSAKTVNRNTDWKDNLTLFGRDVNSVDSSALAHENYANALQQGYQLSNNPGRDRWMLEEAIKQYRAAINIFPNKADPWARIGEILATEYNKPDEAMTYYEKAMQLAPNFGRFYFDLAYCYEIKLNYPLAIENYRLAMKLDTGLTDSWQNLAVLYSKMGMNDSAIIYNQVLIDRDSNSEHGNANMGFFYKKEQKYSSAIPYFKRALKINPNRRDVTVALDSVYMLDKPQ